MVFNPGWRAREKQQQRERLAMARRAWTFKQRVMQHLVLLVCIGVTLAVGLPALCVSGYGGASGEHVGYVTAVEDLQNVTWNATIVYFKTNTESTQEDKYCVQDAKVRDALQAYAAQRVPVVFRYANGFFMWRWECNGGDSIIVGVREASERPGRR